MGISELNIKRIRGAFSWHRVASVMVLLGIGALHMAAAGVDLAEIQQASLSGVFSGGQVIQLMDLVIGGLIGAVALMRQFRRAARNRKSGARKSRAPLSKASFAKTSLLKTSLSKTVRRASESGTRAVAQLAHMAGNIANMAQTARSQVSCATPASAPRRCGFAHAPYAHARCGQTGYANARFEPARYATPPYSA